ncbi:lysostaphin resistance A-like protein, partial [Acidobacteriota bacterium]
AVAVQLVVPFMKVTGLTIPDYAPFFLNPTINPADADPSVISPGLPLKGQFVMIPLMAIALLLNIMAEELYFRAWILPKLSKYGNIGWVINAVLFALYHSFQLWLLPVILVGSLIWAFIIYKSKSIWPALVGHLVGNFLLTILGVLMMILG